MSIGPTSFAASAAATPLSQARGTEAERAQRDAAVQERRIKADAKASDAAGISQTDGEEHGPGERDADGRRLWEEPPGKKKATPAALEAPAADAQSKDASGACGGQLDLTG